MHPPTQANDCNLRGNARLARAGLTGAVAAFDQALALTPRPDAPLVNQQRCTWAAAPVQRPLRPIISSRRRPFNPQPERDGVPCRGRRVVRQVPVESQVGQLPADRHPRPGPAGVAHPALFNLTMHLVFKEPHHDCHG
jgi:hypothetical protein